MKMLGMFTFLRQPVIITSTQSIKFFPILYSHPTLNLLPVLKLLLLYVGTLFFFYKNWKNCNPVPQQPNPKPTSLASIIYSIYNKPASLNDKPASLTQFTEASQNPTKKPTKRWLCLKGMGPGLKMYTQLYIWTLGSSMDVVTSENCKEGMEKLRSRSEARGAVVHTVGSKWFVSASRHS